MKTMFTVLFLAVLSCGIGVYYGFHGNSFMEAASFTVMLVMAIIAAVIELFISADDELPKSNATVSKEKGDA